MSNHNRGLWGYHGSTPGGRELTVQATGIGGPSAAAVIAELAELGLRRAIRIGTCAAFGAAPPAGAVLVVEGALGADGTTAAFGLSGTSLAPDPGLFTALRRAGDATPIVVLSRDLQTSADSPQTTQTTQTTQTNFGGAAVGDLQTAATFAACRRVGIAAAGLLAVAVSEGRRLEDEPLEAALLRLGSSAVDAFAAFEGQESL